MHKLPVDVNILLKNPALMEEGQSDLCPLFEKQKLVSDLSEVTGVAAESATAILDALTYGNGTDTPDPALQPLRGGSRVARSWPSVALPGSAVGLLVFPNEPVVFGGVLLFEVQHAGQFFGGLDHQAFHFVVRDSAVARLVEEG